jgi:hypothetical protein
MSSVRIASCRARISRHFAIASGDIISVRAGEASTWQCRQAWLQSLVMLTCSVSTPSGASAMPWRRSCFSKS